MGYTPEYQRRYRAEHREQRNKTERERIARLKAADPDYQKRLYDRAKASMAKKPDKYRNRYLWTKYRIRFEDYERMLSAQNGVCAICKQPENTARFKYLAVDHDHGTGAVRGLLCHTCNLGIGCLKDKPELLRLAALYIEQRI